MITGTRRFDSHNGQQKDRQSWARKRLIERISGQNLHLFRGLPGSGRKQMVDSMLTKGEYIHRTGMTIEEFKATRIINVDDMFLEDGHFKVKSQEVIASTYEKARAKAIELFLNETNRRKDVCVIGVYANRCEMFKLMDELRMFGVNLIVWEPNNPWANSAEKCYANSNKKMPLSIMQDIAAKFEPGLPDWQFLQEYAKWLTVSHSASYFLGRKVREELEGIPQQKSFAADNKSVVVTEQKQESAVELAAQLNIGTEIKVKL